MSDGFYEIKNAIEFAMQDEANGKPCGSIIEAGCEARRYVDPSYAASGFIWAAADAVHRLVRDQLNELPGLRRQRDELHATTNRYLERARFAEQRVGARDWHVAKLQSKIVRQSRALTKGDASNRRLRDIVSALRGRCDNLFEELDGYEKASAASPAKAMAWLQRKVARQTKVINELARYRAMHYAERARRPNLNAVYGKLGRPVITSIIFDEASKITPEMMKNLQAQQDDMRGVFERYWSPERHVVKSSIWRRLWLAIPITTPRDCAYWALGIVTGGAFVLLFDKLFG